jgi:hypothetical protein
MKKYRVALGFLAGVVFTLVTVFGFFSAQDVGAASGCIRTDLDAYGSNGDVPKSKFTVGYQFPKCLLDKGYKPVKVWKTDNRNLRVEYEK